MGGTADRDRARPSRRALLAIAGAGASTAACASWGVGEDAFDLVLRDGRVIDPESGLDAVRNVAIKGSKIVMITDRPVAGRQTVDAAGLVVAPGFIDLHAHGQGPFERRLHAQDGVTSALELEAGVYPVEPWYRRRIGSSSINFGASASHGAARAIAFGDAVEDQLTGEPEVDGRRFPPIHGSERAASTEAQRRQMAEILNKALDAGAVGVGYHIGGTPGADREELTTFFALAAHRGAPNFIHIRSVGQVNPARAGEEVIGIAKIAGAAVHIVHVNSSGLWETRALLDMIDAARAQGLDVTTEAYPYTGAHGTLDSPSASLAGLRAFRMTYSDVELLRTGERLTEETMAKYKRLYPHDDVVAHIMKQDDVDFAIEHPGVSIGSDGGQYTERRSLPRAAGTFSRIFARHVRERKTLSLMEAIAKVSYLPAKRLRPYAPGMRVRGAIRPGAIADLTVFDANRIQDRATYQQPALPSEGIAFVLVGGAPVVDGYRFRDDIKTGQPIYGAGRRS